MGNREIKFRAWEKELEEMIPAENIAGFKLEPIDGNNNHDRILYYSLLNKIGRGGYCWEKLNSEFYELMQFTGLKDNNGMGNICLFEGDIISLSGELIGNKYENEDLLKEKTNLLITEMGCRAWRSTEQEAVKRGFNYAE
jgi:arylamine N-acetyltransferase